MSRPLHFPSIPCSSRMIIECVFLLFTIQVPFSVNMLPIENGLLWQLKEDRLYHDLSIYNASSYSRDCLHYLIQNKEATLFMHFLLFYACIPLSIPIFPREHIRCSIMHCCINQPDSTLNEYKNSPVWLEARTILSLWSNILLMFYSSFIS